MWTVEVNSTTIPSGLYFPSRYARLGRIFVVLQVSHFICSNNSYGSHIHRSYKNDSHKGSYEDNINILHGEEKKDVSKEDVGHEIGISAELNKIVINNQN